MRRPQTLDWSPHHTYCCQALVEGGHDADLRLVQVCQLLKLSQDVSRTFCYDTRPKSTHPSLLHLRTFLLGINPDPCRTLRPLGISHPQRLSPTTRTLARKQHLHKPIRLHLVPPHKPLPPRSLPPLLPLPRRSPPALRLQRPRRPPAPNLRPVSLGGTRRLYLQGRVQCAETAGLYVWSAFPG